MTACIGNETKEKDLEARVNELSEKYGLKSEKVVSFDPAIPQAINLEFHELEDFFNYRRQSVLGEKETNFSIILEIFRKNGINVNLEEAGFQELKLEGIDQLNNGSRIFCFQNSHNVRVRVPAMMLPGPDLNGVQIFLGVGGGNLNSSSFGMYGISPFMGVSSSIVNPEYGSSAFNSSTNSYGFLIDYTVSFNLFIDGTAFLNYASYQIKVRIDGCTGEVTWHYAIP